MKKVIKVGMADLQSANDKCILCTHGLGSCVGVVLYDNITKISGLAHIMLPSSLNAKNKSNTAKFADTAIVKLIEDMHQLGASKRNITAKLVGGSQMFSSAYLSDISRIGANNIKAAKEKLAELGIPIIAEDTGGNYGRTIEMHSENGNLYIKTFEHGLKQI